MKPNPKPNRTYELVRVYDDLSPIGRLKLRWCLASLAFRRRLYWAAFGLVIEDMTLPALALVFLVVYFWTMAGGL